MCVCILYAHIGALSQHGNPHNVYVCVLYFSINARRPFTQLLWSFIQWFLLYIICAAVRMNYVHWRLLPSGGGPWNPNMQPSDVTYHLVTVRRNPPWQCDIWIGRNETTKVQHNIIYRVFACFHQSPPIHCPSQVDRNPYNAFGFHRRQPEHSHPRIPQAYNVVCYVLTLPHRTETNRSLKTNFSVKFPASSLRAVRLAPCYLSWID